MALSVKIENGVVANIAVGSVAGYQDLTAQQEADGVTIGWTWDGAAFSAPAAPDPPTNAELAATIILSRIQFLQALASNQTQALDAIEDYIVAAITAAEGAAQLTAAQAQAARFFVRNANFFPRVDPDANQAALLMAVAAILGLNAAAVDQLFIDGKAL